MRVLAWASSYWPAVGGGPVLAASLMPALAARGHDIVVVTDRRPPELPEAASHDGIPIVRLPFRQALGGDLAAVPRLRRRLVALTQTHAPQLVHLYSLGYAELFHHETACSPPLPLLATLHRTFPATSVQPDGAIGRSLRAADRVTACSVAVLAATVAQVPEIAGKSSVVLNALPEPPGAVDAASFAPPKLLAVGVAVAHKGFDLALAAFARLRPGRPTLSLTIAGDGPALPALRQQAASLGVADAVDLRGRVEPDEVPGLMRASSLVLMPSRIEPFGLVALQAAQCGRAIVAARVGGLPEIVVDGVTGLLVPPDDAEALARAIGALLDDPARAVRIGLAARRHAQASFVWDRFVDAYDELYRRLGQP